MSDQRNEQVIRQLQMKNNELNNEIGILQSEVRVLRNSDAGMAERSTQMQELKRRNYELQTELDQLRERLAIYEQSDNDHAASLDFNRP